MKNYRKVTIKRKLPFYHEANKELRDWFSDANTAIGAFWEKKGSSKQGSGLTIEEEDLLMPGILSVSSSDLQFRKEVSKYFRDINTVIPQEGLTLIISLRDDDEELSETNLPRVPHDYVVYRHARAHPFTAGSFKECTSNPLKRYYVEDEKEIMKAEKAKTDLVDVALGDYFDVKKNKKKVTMILALMGKKVKDNQDPVVALKEAAEKSPEKFHNISTDNDLQTRYVINTMISASVLDIVNGKILRTDTNETLGTENQAVAWFKDKANTKDVAMFKAMMQEVEAEDDFTKDPEEDFELETEKED